MRGARVEITPRLALLALLLLVVPALVTALFLARVAQPVPVHGAQPGGAIAGRIVPRVPSDGASLLGVELVVAGVTAEGARSELARARTDGEGHFAAEVAPFDGLYELRVVPGAWRTSVLPFSTIGRDPSELAELVLVVEAAARLELAFAPRAGVAVRGGTYAIEGEGPRHWFSGSGARFERSGRFEGATLAVGDLPATRATVRVRLDGGDRVELVVDLALGPNRHTVER